MQITLDYRMFDSIQTKLKKWGFTFDNTRWNGHRTCACVYRLLNPVKVVSGGRLQSRRGRRGRYFGFVLLQQLFWFDTTLHLLLRNRNVIYLSPPPTGCNHTVIYERIRPVRGVCDE